MSKIRSSSFDHPLSRLADTTEPTIPNAFPKHSSGWFVGNTPLKRTTFPLQRFSHRRRSMNSITEKSRRDESQIMKTKSALDFNAEFLCTTANNQTQFNSDKEKFTVKDIMDLVEGINSEQADLDYIMEKLVETKENIYMGKTKKELMYKVEEAIGIVTRCEVTRSTVQQNLFPMEVSQWSSDSFNDVEIGAMIGGGGFCDNFAAVWNKTHILSVKIVKLKHIPESKLKEFNEETKNIVSLQHQTLVKYFGVCIQNQELRIAMEFLDGGSLYDIIHMERIPDSLLPKYPMICDCLDGLNYLHENNIAHKDIRSKNILVSRGNYRCKLGDFGLALKDYTRLHCSINDPSILATFVYSSPEIIRGEMLTLDGLKNADVYSMGVVLAELLTQIQPFAGLNLPQVREAVLRGYSKPNLDKVESKRLQKILEQAMNLNPSSRPSASYLQASVMKTKDAGDF